MERIYPNTNTHGLADQSAPGSARRMNYGTCASQSTVFINNWLAGNPILLTKPNQTEALVLDARMKVYNRIYNTIAWDKKLIESKEGLIVLSAATFPGPGKLLQHIIKHTGHFYINTGGHAVAMIYLGDNDYYYFDPNFGLFKARSLTYDNLWSQIGRQFMAGIFQIPIVQPLIAINVGTDRRTRPAPPPPPGQ